MSTVSSLLKPEERVLSTLNRDGSRRWIKPRVVAGRFWKARRIVAYALIALFVSLPWITISGKPAVLLDIVHREFTLFGRTFLPTDTLLLMLVVVGIFLSVFFATALLGRVWCGWACPQTVYMEFVFRPIQRWAEGAPGSRSKPSLPGLRKGVQYGLYVIIAFFLAHTFLSYFVGVDALRHWIFQSPGEHFTGFLVVMFVTAAMLFDFVFFREQTCIVACPYGRFQSVMLDRNSLIVSYDPKRGEPRGKAGKSKPVHGDLHLKVVGEGSAAPAEGSAERSGDCVDCSLCVQVCPTGIDIRQGLQMECINCAQCIDACDSVMDKLKRPRGLIRYSSQNAIDRKPVRLLRPRIVLYPAILLVVFSVLVWRLATMQEAYVWIVRGRGLPYNTLPSGEIANQLKVRIVNRSPEERAYTLEMISPAGGRIMMDRNPIVVSKGELLEEGFVVAMPPGSFPGGRVEATFQVTDGKDVKITRTYKLLGPAGPAGVKP